MRSQRSCSGCPGPARSPPRTWPSCTSSGTPGSWTWRCGARPRRGGAPRRARRVHAPRLRERSDRPDPGGGRGGSRLRAHGRRAPRSARAAGGGARRAPRRDPRRASRRCAPSPRRASTSTRPTPGTSRRRTSRAGQVRCWARSRMRSAGSASGAAVPRISSCASLASRTRGRAPSSTARRRRASRGERPCAGQRRGRDHPRPGAGPVDHRVRAPSSAWSSSDTAGLFAGGAAPTALDARAVGARARRARGAADLVLVVADASGPDEQAAGAARARSGRGGSSSGTRSIWQERRLGRREALLEAAAAGHGWVGISAGAGTGLGELAGPARRRSIETRPAPPSPQGPDWRRATSRLSGPRRPEPRVPPRGSRVDAPLDLVAQELPGGDRRPRRDLRADHA